MKWSSRTLGARWQYGFFALLVRLRLLPLARLFLRPVAAWYALSPKTRGRTAPYLSLQFPRFGPVRRVFSCYRIYLEFALVLFERMAWRLGKPRDVRVSDKARAVLGETLARGRGCMVLSAHLGAWQLAIAGLEENSSVPVNIVQYRQGGDTEKHYFEHGGCGRLRVVNVAEGPKTWIQVASALTRGEIVCMMGDRCLPNEPMPLPATFLGQPALFPGAVYRVAARTGTPILFSFSTLEKGAVRIEDFEVCDLPGDAGGRECAEACRRFVLAMERFVGKHPYQFFNFYDLWTREET